MGYLVLEADLELERGRKFDEKILASPTLQGIKDIIKEVDIDSSR